MKLITSFFFLFSFTVSFSQDTLYYKDLENLEIVKNIKSNEKFKYYVDKNNNLFSVGQELKIGTPSNPQESTKDILTGKMVKGGFTFLSVFIDTQLEQKYQNETLIIESIRPMHTGFTKKSPLYVYFVCISNSNLGGYKYIKVNYPEKAIESGEIIFESKILSKEKAIKLLKEKKELLDLGIITSNEYNKFKSELTPIILKE